MSIFEPAVLARRIYGDAAQKGTSILFDCFGIEHFYYHKLSDSGRFFLFESSFDLLESLNSQVFLSHYPAYCHPKFHQSGSFMTTITSDKRYTNLETTRKNFLHNNFKMAYRSITQNSVCVEEFGFSMSNSNEDYCRFISNNSANLKLFSEWFLSEHRSLLSFLDESCLDFSRLLGNDFYKNKILDSDPLYHSRRRFLESIQINIEHRLTSEEIHTVELLLQGYTASQIAQQVFRSRRTIEHRIEKIKDKWSCHSRAELFEKAREIQNFLPYFAGS